MVLGRVLEISKGMSIDLSENLQREWSGVLGEWKRDGGD